MKIFYIFVFLLIAQSLSAPYPKFYNLVRNIKNGDKVYHSEFSADEMGPLQLKMSQQSRQSSQSIFTKERVSLKQGLNLRANLLMDMSQSTNTEGIAIIIQNHSDGNQYVGNHEYYLGVKPRSVQCAGLTIRAYQNDSKFYLIINFGEQELYNQVLSSFVREQIQQIFLEIQVLENDEALLYFGIGTQSIRRGPQNLLKLSNFRQGLCLTEQEDLSAYVGFSASQFGSNCYHETQLLSFKFVEQDCGCPADNNFPLNITYQNEFTEITAMEKTTVTIEQPKICNLCENIEGNDKEINLLLDYSWKLQGTKFMSGNKSFIKFVLPSISADNEQINNQHLLTFLVGETSFAQKQFKVLSNTFLEENWKTSNVKLSSSDSRNSPQIPLTGFQEGQLTQPPNIPPLNDNLRTLLSQNQAKTYTVDVYSQPIVKSRQDNSLLEHLERIKVDTISNNINNYNGIINVKEWNPSEQIPLTQDHYELLGHNYEYEFKHEDGSILKTITTHPEVALNTLYDGACYGNFCANFFCKPSPNSNPAPISQLDKVCKEMNDDPLSSLGVVEHAADFFNLPFSKAVSKYLMINDVQYLYRVIMADCQQQDYQQCEAAKAIIIAKFAVNVAIKGRLSFILDVAIYIFQKSNYYLHNTKLGQWILGKFTGDPHLKNLDGCMFDFHGTGDFILLEEKLIGLAIHSRFQQHISFPNVSTIKSIAVRGFLGAPIVSFESLFDEKLPLIRVNGIIISIEDKKVFEIPNVSIRVEKDNYFIEFTNGVLITVTNAGYGFLWTGFLRIPAIYSGKLQGLLGNGDSEDNETDFKLGPNPQEEYEIIKSCKLVNHKNIWKFGMSWRLTKKEDSILFYKNNEDPNMYYDKDWHPVPLEIILNQVDKSKLAAAQKQCQPLQKDSEEDYQNCIVDFILLENKDQNTVPVLDAYTNSKEKPEEGKITLIYKDVTESSIGLQFGINTPVLNSCSKGCNTKILSKKEGESEFSVLLQLSNSIDIMNTEIISGLEKNTLYYFKVEVDGIFESNLVSLYTQQICVPYCDSQKACGDDGCGGKCVEKKKCLDCKFGVCEVYQKDDDNNNNNNNNNNKPIDPTIPNNSGLINLLFAICLIAIIMISQRQNNS